MLTITGPGWLCQANCAPGWTVNLATSVREGSLAFTTLVSPPSSLTLILRSTSSVKTARPVKNSVAMGGGGCCAADGSTFAPISATAMNAIANAAARFLVMSITPSACGPHATAGQGEHRPADERDRAGSAPVEAGVGRRQARSVDRRGRLPRGRAGAPRRQHLLLARGWGRRVVGGDPLPLAGGGRVQELLDGPSGRRRRHQRNECEECDGELHGSSLVGRVPAARGASRGRSGRAGRRAPPRTAGSGRTSAPRGSARRPRPTSPARSP